MANYAAASAHSIVHVLLERALRSPDRTAYRFRQAEEPWTEMSWSELAARSAVLADWLISETSPGDRVLIAVSPGLDFIRLLFAAFLAGRIAVPAAAPRAPRSQAHLTAILADCRPAVAFVDDDVQVAALDRLKSVHAPSRIVRVNELPAGDRAGTFNPTHSNIAFLQYTSGSTDRPKGVIVSHANVLDNLERQRRLYGADMDSRGVIWLPPHHDMGLHSGVLQPAFSGSAVSLLSPLHTMQRPMRWLKAISECRATISGAPPSAYAACLRSVEADALEHLDLADWRCAFVGAEAIDPRILQDFALSFEPFGFSPKSFLPCYGLAEATVLVCGDSQAQGLHVLRRSDGAEVALCGLPETGLELVVVDEQAERVAEGSEGEIWLRGASVAEGYWEAPEASKATFEARMRNGEGPFLRTGDLGVQTGKGVAITGRLKDLVIFAGRKIHAQDVEATIRSVADDDIRLNHGIAAFPINPTGKEQLGVAVELRRPNEELIDLLRRRISAAVSRNHAIGVSAFIVVEPGALPRTSSGKIRRHACRDLLPAELAL